MPLSRPTIGEDLQADLHDLYRHLHRHPELSMQEHATADLIAERMTALGAETFRCGGTGVVAVQRNGDGPVVAFRADTDGLPVAEETGLDYASTATGTLRDGADSAVPVMHACGHDTHIASAIGAATLLARDTGSWSGTVVWLFQPGEETAEGAAAMVADGLWDAAPHPEVVYGQHVWPGTAGTLEVATGPAMAMADSWKVTVRGRGGHGSQPHTTIDPVVLAAHMVVRLQTVTAREVPPQQAAVVTVASFHAGLKENIIPAEAVFTVNVRSLDTEVREKVLEAIRRIVTAEAQASGAPEPLVEETYRFPLTDNDEAATGALVTTFREVLGEDAVKAAAPVMGSEDFGTLASAIGVPAVYWFFGGLPPEVVDGDEPVPSNHSPHFAPVLEPTLSTGVTAAWTAVMSRVGSQR